MNIRDFHGQLNASEASVIVQKHLFDSSPFCFASDPALYETFRKEICERFQIHPQNFAVVGSAKLGFSLNPDHYGTPFSDTSDIDVVLVSEELFQEMWLALLDYRRTVLFTLDPRYQKAFNELQWIFFFGQVRLDKLSNHFSFAKDWWEFFNSMSVDPRFGPRRVRGAIFKTWKHVSFYYEDTIKKLKDKYESDLF